MARTARHATAPDRVFDLCVVGAGITGAAVAREAALRGASTVVVERADVASGTSSRSSRLVHGGVRYLEQGDLHLVHEALAERRTLCETAPGLVRLERFVFPAYRGDRRPLWQLRVGLALYDVLSGFAGRAERLDAAETAEAEPLLRRAGLAGAMRYDDARTDDARLALAVVQDARRHGALVLTYTPALAVTRTGDRYEIETRRGTIRARTVVVAAGPFTGEALAGPPARGLVVRSRGVHLVFRHEDLPVRAPLVLQVPERHRIVFVLPWGPRTYVGTTDTPYEGDPDAVCVTREDIEELLAIVAPRLAAPGLRKDAIVGAYAGLRPLVRAPGARDVADLSRSHRIVEAAPGHLAIVGGKLTTHRVMGEDAAARVFAHLRRPFTRGLSARRPLVPGPPPDTRDPLVADLATRHGALAPWLAARARAEGARRIVPGLPYLEVEATHALDFEGCVHLSDLLRRRLPLALVDAEASLAVAPRLARRLVAAAGRPAAEADDEVARYVEALSREAGAALPWLAPPPAVPKS